MTAHRDNFADIAKGIGILLMVYGHVARGLEFRGISIPEPWYTCVDSVIYSFHMPLFFFLSGLYWLPSIARKGVADTAWSKLDTIAYPYILWSLIQGGAEVLMSHYTNGQVTMEQVLALWVPRAQFWFLFTLFVMFMLAALLYRFQRVWTTPALLIASTLVYFDGRLVPDFYQAWLLAATLVYFALGIAFQQFGGHRLMDSSGKRWGWVAAFMCLQLGLHVIGWRSSDPKGGVSLLVASVSILAICAISFEIKGTLRRTLLYIGAATLPIYLMHVIFGSGARIILRSVFNVHDTLPHLVIGILAGVTLPIVVYTWMRLPGKSYLFQAPISRLVRGAQATKAKPNGVRVD